MKKLLLSLSLISFITQAMAVVVDEEAAVSLPAAGQEQHQNEGEKVLQEKKKHFCIRIGERLKTCPHRTTDTMWMIIALGTSVSLATGVIILTYVTFS